MSKNKYSQAQKKEICDKHRRLLDVVFYRIGFEKILQQQAIEIALLFGYYATERDVKMAIQELEKYQLIKKIPTSNSNKFLILCKYARAYVRGIEDSQKVAAFDSSMTLANQFERIARVQLFIKHVKKYKYHHFESINSWNTYTTREDLTHVLYKRIMRIDFPEIHEENLKKLLDKALSELNFKPAKRDENHERKEKKQFNLDTNVVTLRQLIQKNIYLANMFANQQQLIFRFNLVDANNRYTHRKFKENILYVQSFVEHITKKVYGGRKILIDIKYICTEKSKLESIKNEMNHRVWDNKKACFTGSSRLEALDPSKTLETLHIEQKIEFHLLDSNYFKIHQNLE